MSTLEEPGTCGAPSRALLPLEEARRRVREAVSRVDGNEQVDLTQALGRILAEDVVSPINVPGHTNSALDGYAFRGTDIPAQNDAELRVVGIAWAGRPHRGEVTPGQAVRIMTGAPMPRGTDTVVAQELVEIRDDTLTLGANHRSGQNVRAAGEDLAKGEVALRAGKRLLPAELGLLASLGLDSVTVVRKLRVAFFSTGDELRCAGESIEDGSVYDANRFTLMGMLTRLGAEVHDKGIIRDKREAVREAVLSASTQVDVIITSGGVSTGDADYVQEVLEEHGSLGFWRVAIKPGRPLAFGRIGQALFFGLPGNPVAVMVTFYQFLHYALSSMMGESSPLLIPLVKVRCTTRLSKRAGRTEFYRAILERRADGETTVRRTGKQGSGVLHSMSEANCFIILPDDCETVEPGALVDVQPFFGLV